MHGLLCLSVLLATSGAAPACMGVGREGQPVRFAGQTNIVIWDKARGIEHFVRDAKFSTDGPDLGFIAPTPTQPQICAADRAAFALVASLNRASGSRSMAGFGGGPGSGGGGGVTVVEKKIVSGYEATVLKADDPRALTDWLGKHGYAVRPYAARWAAPYVRRGWYFTAFKVAAGQGAGATGPVRLTFYTQVPFNPYSVPVENRGTGGLSLYYISATAEVAKIGGVQPWVESRWSEMLSEEEAKQLADDLKFAPSALPERSFVRFYRDETFGRPGFDDIYFVPLPKGVGHWSGLLGTLSGIVLLAFAYTGRRMG